jgi:hypothetical protein
MLRWKLNLMTVLVIAAVLANVGGALFGFRW